MKKTRQIFWKSKQINFLFKSYRECTWAWMNCRRRCPWGNVKKRKRRNSLKMSWWLRPTRRLNCTKSVREFVRNDRQCNPKRFRRRYCRKRKRLEPAVRYRLDHTPNYSNNNNNIKKLKKKTIMIIIFFFKLFDLDCPIIYANINGETHHTSARIFTSAIILKRDRELKHKTTSARSSIILT